MGTTTTAVCTSFKTQILEAVHNFTATTGNVFAIALIKPTPTGTYGSGTSGYTSITTNADEANGTGYTAGGFIWTAAQNITPSVTSGVVVSTSWTVNPSWTGASFSAQAGLLYNTNQPAATSGSVACYDFGGTQTVSSGTFTLVLPANSGTTAILSIQ